MKDEITNCHHCHLAGRSAPASWVDRDGAFYCDACLSSEEVPSNRVITIHQWLKAKSKPEAKATYQATVTDSPPEHEKSEPPSVIKKRKYTKRVIEPKSTEEAVEMQSDAASNTSEAVDEMPEKTTLTVTDAQMVRMFSSLPIEGKAAVLQIYLDSSDA